MTFKSLHRTPRTAKRILPATTRTAITALTLILLSVPVLAPPASAAPSAEGSAGMTYVTSVEGIHEYRLDNGLQLLLFPDPSRRTATVAITYLVGSRHESYGETGMAHLLEHLMFKGSKNHPNIPDELTARGARPNGSTWADRTNYFESFNATEDNLRWAIGLEADRMVNALLSPEDLESEMTVVRNEFEIGENNPERVLSQRILSTAYLWHNYGNSTIGARSDIEGVPMERIRAFYETWYQPDNAVLVVAGRFEPEFVLAEVVDTFGRIPRPARVLPQTYTMEPPQDGERTVTLRRVGDYQAMGIAYHVPSGSHPDFAAVQILAHILGDQPSGRLYRALVESRMATSVGAWARQFRDPTTIFFQARVRRDRSLEDVTGEMLRIVEGAGVEPPTDEEMERARKALLRNWETSMRNSQGAAIGLSEWAAMGDWRLLFLHRDRLREATAEDVQRVAASYLVRNNRTLGTYIPTDAPERVEIPQPPDLEELLYGYTGGEPMAEGEEFDPRPERIEEMILRAELPSGLRLIMLPKKTRGGSVHFQLQLRLGNEEALQGWRTAADMAGSMLMRGTEKRTRQEIRDALDDMHTRMHVGGGASYANAGGETTRDHLAGVLRLAAEILREPAFPETEFDQLLEQRLISLEESRTDPRTRAANLIDRHLSPWPPNDPRYQATVEEQIEELQHVTVDELREFHREFYCAGSGELAIVGDFDPQVIRDLAVELFGDWNCGVEPVRLAGGYREIRPIREVIEIADRESAAFRAGMRLNIRDDDPDYPALTLASFMTGGGFLNSRLATRIRQDDGLSYSVGGWLSASAFERDGWFGAHAMYAPQNIEALERAFREEIERIVADGFTPEEVAEAKSGWLQGREMSRAQERSLVWTLTGREREGRDLLWDAAFEEKVSLLTPEEIHEAVRRHIDPAGISIVHAGNFQRDTEDHPTLHGGYSE